MTVMAEGRWRRALPPLLTALTVLVLTLLPPRLSGLGDRSLAGTVHTEGVSGDSNFPIQPPDLPERLRLLAQYRYAPDSLAVVQREAETPRERAEADALARAALKALTGAGVLPAGQPDFAEGFTAVRTYLRNPRNLSGAGFLDIQSVERREYRLSMVLDLETGKAVHFFLLGYPALADPIPPETIGTRFLRHLGLEWEAAAELGSPYAVEISLPECPGVLCQTTAFPTLLACSFYPDAAARAEPDGANPAE